MGMYKTYNYNTEYTVEIHNHKMKEKRDTIQQI